MFQITVTSLGGTLRDQWIALLESLDDASTVVQLESRRQEQFYYSEEVLSVNFCLDK